MDNMKVKWGIISCAGIAESSVIPGILGAQNAELYAISSRGPDKLEKFKNKFNPVKAYESYEELLDDPQVDAVYIPLPNGLHYEWTLKAAAKKKHVLCEKPMGISEEQVIKMKEACDKNGVLLMEAFAYRHSPLTVKVKELVDSGAIGKVKFMESHFSFMLKDPKDVRFFDSLAGGATYDIGCYNINVIRYIIGEEPVSLYATGEVGEKSGVDESSCIVMDFDGGVKAVSYCSFHCTLRSEYTIVGEKGIISVPVVFNTKGDTKIVVKKDEGIEEIKVTCPDNYMLEVEQLGRCILHGEKPYITFEDSLNNSRVIDEALRQIIKK
ncbi:glucose--fructose oxidoreductase precursor [Ruminiclostridium hungatei]|uniref:Glucose--fructose oxidoreductase n=1 Tax=Ruminiclostridium hungatei TaxID=48256 RepID=A0A1V4SDM4_RUMHU|nr:Gfo/Idh/MocA family oxidoreductase [Ruminiclostridium hungatei]OPX41924.1 glucose--fructose oxidoreductase precursor [Ruminiclostridium hungatei]